MIIRLFMILSFVLLAPEAFSSSCQGISQSKCERLDKCYWVPSKKITPHCRTKRGDGKATSSKRSSKAKKKKKSKTTKASKKPKKDKDSDIKKKKKKKKKNKKKSKKKKSKK